MNNRSFFISLPFTSLRLSHDLRYPLCESLTRQVLYYLLMLCLVIEEYLIRLLIEEEEKITQPPKSFLKTAPAIIGFFRSEGKPRAHFLPSPNESRRLALPNYQL